jgi:HlyD family secretion protein
LVRWFKRILPWALGASIVAARVWAYLPKPVQVDLASATRGSFEMTVTEPGKTRVRLRYTVTALSSGVLARVVVRPGDVVDAGEVLSRIRPLDSPLLDARTRAQAVARVNAMRAAREQAVQQLERARARRGLARVDLQRQTLLARDGTAPARDLQVAEIDELTRRKEAEAAEWAVRVATSELASTSGAATNHSLRASVASSQEGSRGFLPWASRSSG